MGARPTNVRTNPGFHNLGRAWDSLGVQNDDPQKPRSQLSSDRRIVPSSPQKMTAIRKRLEADFDYVDVGPKIPNYTPGTTMGHTGRNLERLMQQPLSKRRIDKAHLSHRRNGMSNSTRMNVTFRRKTNRHDLGSKSRPAVDLRDGTTIPTNCNPPGKRDRIRICEDTDGDGMWPTSSLCLLKDSAFRPLPS